MEINNKSGQTFAGSLRSIMRQRPRRDHDRRDPRPGDGDYRLPGRDDGHFVFSTVHSNDTITALFRLLDLASSRS